MKLISTLLTQWISRSTYQETSLIYIIKLRNILNQLKTLILPKLSYFCFTKIKSLRNSYRWKRPEFNLIAPFTFWLRIRISNLLNKDHTLKMITSNRLLQNKMMLKIKSFQSIYYLNNLKKDIKPFQNS